MARSFLLLSLLKEADNVDDIASRRQSQRIRNLHLMSRDYEYVHIYRLTDHLIKNLEEELSPLLPKSTQRRRSLTHRIKLLSTLSFLANGSYQKVLGKNVNTFLSQTSTSRSLHQIINALNHPTIVKKYIRFPQNVAERQTLKERFYEKFNIPGVIGCIDGTMVSMIRPKENEERYFCRKGYHARNVQLITDADLNILHVDSSYGGASHDSFVFNNSQIKNHLEEICNSGEVVYLLVSQEADDETKRVCPADGSGNLLLDCPHATLYLRFPHERELKGWRCMIKLAAHNNGAQIYHQQLTKEDVPTVVDKCLSFVYAHGSLSEGIYRRAGSSTVLSELLARFRRDAWSVQLSPSQHSEHDVAGVLKRFFRDLPESLVPQDKHQELTAALEIKEPEARHAEYQRIMTSLPLVARNTARKLFAHLHFLSTMAHANKMSAENMASVWAPTIMPAALTSNTLQTAWSSKEVFVVRDLIANFEAVWQPTDGEKRREEAVRRVLMTVLGNAVPATKKAAGDLKAWVYIKDRSVCHQITLTPNKTSADICIELCEKAKMESHLLMLEEVICKESMRRIVHIDEIVLDVVLRWGYWDEEDRKDNYLVVTENKVLNEIEALKHSTSTVCGELKLALDNAKAFKAHMFELHNGVLCCFKDKQGSHQLEEWKVKDILWYIGHEPKRNPQSRWAITIVPRNNKQKRSKDHPWFGTTIAGSVTEDQLKWMSALMFGEYSNVLPTPRLVIT